MSNGDRFSRRRMLKGIKTTGLAAGVTALGAQPASASHHWTIRVHYHSTIDPDPYLDALRNARDILTDDQSQITLYILKGEEFKGTPSDESSSSSWHSWFRSEFPTLDDRADSPRDGHLFLIDRTWSTDLGYGRVFGRCSPLGYESNSYPSDDQAALGYVNIGALKTWDNEPTAKALTIHEAGHMLISNSYNDSDNNDHSCSNFYVEFMAKDDSSCPEVDTNAFYITEIFPLAVAYTHEEPNGNSDCGPTSTMFSGRDPAPSEFSDGRPNCTYYSHYCSTTYKLWWFRERDSEYAAGGDVDEPPYPTSTAIGKTWDKYMT